MLLYATCIYSSVILAFAFIIGIYIRETTVNIEQYGMKKSLHETGLVIGILSARENFIFRNSIRKTWLGAHGYLDNQKTMKNSFHVKPWFIIGHKFCGTPPSYRTNKYDCEKWNLNISDVQETFFTLAEVKNGVKCLPDELKIFHQGFSFQVNHPVLIKSLGVFSKLLPKNYNVSVALLDALTKEIVVQTSVTLNQPGVLMNGYFYRPVENFVLPKGYEGIVLVEGYLLHSTCGDIRWLDGGGVLNFRRVYPTPNDFEAIPFSQDLFVASSIRVSVLEIDNLKQTASQESVIFSEWQNYQLSVMETLQKEAETWEDILLVDVVDVYRNIPQKLLHFYKWLSENEEFSYVLKTDDDCALDVSAILHELSKNSQFSLDGMWWWSRFRHHWPVNYFGKWADLSYKSPVYPSFPCGAGYVLSQKVVHWLARNLPYLYAYQGEDVSMGIWLASVNPTYIEDYRWQCDSSCNSSGFNRAQLTESDMYDVWTKFTDCGDLCSCNFTEKMMHDCVPAWGTGFFTK